MRPRDGERRCSQEVRVWAAMDRAAASSRARPPVSAAKRWCRQMGTPAQRSKHRAPASPQHTPQCSTTPLADTASPHRTDISASRGRRQRCPARLSARAKASTPRRRSAIPPPQRRGNPERQTGCANVSSPNNMPFLTETANHHGVTSGSSPAAVAMSCAAAGYYFLAHLWRRLRQWGSRVVAPRDGD